MPKLFILRIILASGSALMMSGAAPAAIVETVTVANSYGYNFPAAGGGVDVVSGGTRETVFAGSKVPGFDSEAGIDYVGEANAGSFFFLHNNYCVGRCSTSSSTVITFTVTNTGSEAVALRFDSLITPGHLATIGDGPAARGGFDFTVTQRDPSQGDEAPRDLLYSAFGNVNAEEIFVETTGGIPFNGYTDQMIGDSRIVDWSTTALNLEMGVLGAGQTTIIEYTARYFAFSGEGCQNVATCGGLQVVFGDPRKNGTVLSLRSAAGATADESSVPIINREYDPVEIPYAFNLSGSPLPPVPPAQGPVSYSVPFVPLADAGAVPEPTTWLSMILGFGLLGGAMRRRGARSVTA